MDETQTFLFDTFGYFTVPGAITHQQVEELKTTLQQPTEQFAPVDQQVGPLHWGKIWRDMLDLPNISPIVEELVGNHGLLNARQAQRGEDALPTFRIDHINVHTHVENGFPGSILHGGWKGTGGSQFFRYHDGQFYNGLIVVAIELFDTQPNDGGFCCIPGSHKGNVPLPQGWQDLSKGVHPSVTRVPASAGDAIIFTEALTHGTLPWTVDAPRQTLFYKFSPHGTTWSADFFDPADFDQYDDLDNRKRAILEAPNARYHGRPTTPDWRD